MGAKPSQLGFDPIKLLQTNFFDRASWQFHSFQWFLCERCSLLHRRTEEAPQVRTLIKSIWSDLIKKNPAQHLLILSTLPLL